jgi:hypothetical protein
MLGSPAFEPHVLFSAFLATRIRLGGPAGSGPNRAHDIRSLSRAELFHPHSRLALSRCVTLGFRRGQTSRHHPPLKGLLEAYVRDVGGS